MILGLLLIYVPIVRHPFSLLVLSLVLLSLAMIYPEPAVMIAQASGLGLALTLMAGLLERSMARRRKKLLLKEPSKVIRDLSSSRIHHSLMPPVSASFRPSIAGRIATSSRGTASMSRPTLLVPMLSAIVLATVFSPAKAQDRPDRRRFAFSARLCSGRPDERLAHRQRKVFALGNGRIRAIALACPIRQFPTIKVLSPPRPYRRNIGQISRRAIVKRPGDIGNYTFRRIGHNVADITMQSWQFNTRPGFCRDQDIKA